MANSNGWGDGSVNNSIDWGQGANNTIGWGKSHLDSWSGATDIDGGNLPSNSVAPAITGTAQEGQTLTCSTGTWSGSPTYTYQWKRNGNNIGGATSSTYLVSLADVGQSILCTVTATNFVGSATANSNTVTPTSSVDPDAQAFITAASITDPTQQSAINQLVVDLKGYNIWTKMKALYPFVGGTAAQHKWNLKDPRDLDAAFRLVFNGGWTHSSTGVTPNGTNGWANTFLNPNTNYNTNNSFHGAIYSRTNITGDVADFGGINGSTRTDLWLIASDGNIYNRIHLNGIITSNTNSIGFFVSTRNSSTSLKLFKNNTQLGSTYTGANGSRLDTVLSIGAYLVGGIPNYYSSRQYAFISFGEGLIDTESSNFYTAVQAFQTTLNRQAP